LRWGDKLWDAWCIASVIGVWPRFIEPRMLTVTRLELRIPALPPGLKGLKLLHLSDIHFHSGMSAAFLQRVSTKILSLQPDIIVCTGDFLCYGHLEEQARLLEFLKSLHAPLGCFAVLGNHDYASRIGLNARGDYDIAKADERALIAQGFYRLFSNPHISGKATDEVTSMPPHADLVALLHASPFVLLHNDCRQVIVGSGGLNICGLGEYSCGKTLTQAAFEGYEKRYPGILLLHNPDGVPLLREVPGDIILCGHTHGGQVNLPWIWRKCALMEHPQFKQGLVPFFNKWVYINRGLGSIFPFRWFAPPELLLLTLV
jgi:predicted MPP superfamily phosphohydrolase